MKRLNTRRMLCAAAVVATFALGAPRAWAQFEGERGAGPVELNVSPAGGMIFSGTHGSESFGVYTLGGSVTGNVNPWFGVEGELGFGLGAIEQELRVDDAIFASAKPPRLLSYTGNLVYYPGRNDRAVAPYLTGGIGGLTMFSRPEVEQLGVVNNETYFTSNVGAGVKWYATDTVGLRFDYRLIGVTARDDTPAFLANDETRLANRITGSILFTGWR